MDRQTDRQTNVIKGFWGEAFLETSIVFDRL